MGQAIGQNRLKLPMGAEDAIHGQNSFFSGKSQFCSEGLSAN